MEFSVMERNWDCFQLGTGSYTVFNYCSNSFWYNVLSVSQSQLKERHQFRCEYEHELRVLTVTNEKAMFYLVQGKDYSRGSWVAVEAGISSTACTHINYHLHRLSLTHRHTYMHSYREINVYMHTLWSSSFTWTIGKMNFDSSLTKGASSIQSKVKGAEPLGAQGGHLHIQYNTSAWILIALIDLLLIAFIWRKSNKPQQSANFIHLVFKVSIPTVDWVICREEEIEGEK